MPSACSRRASAGVDAGFSAGVLAIRTRLANLEILRGNLSLAESMHREVLDHWHGSVGQWPQAMSLLGLATIARRRDDPAAAVVHLDAAWAMGRTRAVPLMRSLALVAQGYTADQQGDAAKALGAAGRGPARGAAGRRGASARQRGRRAGRCAGGDRRAVRRGARRSAARPRRRHAAPFGGAMPAAERFDVDRAERRARATLGDQAFSCAFEAGATADAHAATADDVMDAAVAAAELARPG